MILRHVFSPIRHGTVNASGFSSVLLVVMAIPQDRLDERIAESHKAQ